MRHQILAVSMPVKMADKVKELANDDFSGISDFVRAAIREYVERRQVRTFDPAVAMPRLMETNATRD